MKASVSFQAAGWLPIPDSASIESQTVGYTPRLDGSGRAVTVAVPCRAPYLKGQIDPRFGRALFFLIVDTTADRFRVVDNTWTAHIPEEAGVRAADSIGEMGVGAVLARHIGPRAFAALQAKDIAVYRTLETFVWDAVQRYREGSLSRLAEPDATERSGGATS